MASVSFRGATRRYAGTGRPAVDGLDLEVRNGEFMVLVGPSGCGKTSTLRMLAGLEGTDSGSIWIGDRDVTRVSPSKRDIAMVFQNYVLYPHLTVRENIGFHLMIAHRPKAEIRQKVDEAAAILGLTDLLERRPARLSGGQKQRVAMGRAIVREPEVFLMDEPLSNLDAQLRVETRVQIAALQRRLGTTTVYVTHDQVEAMTMGDRVAVMKDGVLQQCDTPRTLFDAPANSFVGSFIGSPQMTVLPAVLSEAGAVSGDLAVQVTPSQREAAGSDSVALGLRPNSLTMVGAGEGMRARVEVAENLGSSAFAYCSAELMGGRKQLIVRADPRRIPSPGEVVHLKPTGEDTHLFVGAEGRRAAP